MSAPTFPRVAKIDYARGIGILLVVFGHTWTGLAGASILPPTWPQEFVRSVIYSFHMPLFFVISGVFVRRSLGKGPVAFVRARMARLVYPYVVWSFLQARVNQWLMSQTNSAPTCLGIGLLVTPYKQFWFLYALALCDAVYLVCDGLRLGRLAVLTIGAALYGGLFWGLSGFRLDVSPWLQRNFLYFATGAAAQDALLRPVRLSSGVLLASAGILSIIVVWCVKLGLDQIPSTAPLVAGAGIAWALGTAVLLERMGRFDWVRWLGTLSLQIYLAHVMAAAAVRIGLRRIGVADPWAHLGIGMAAGVLVPVALDRAARTVGFRYLFTFG
jgi:fucose 4-O-acetylase-like acetyltransferase